MSLSSSRQEKELAAFRDIMPVPDHFEHGFGAKTVLGAIFLGLFMLPGSMYLTLFMGAGLGPAARWVTVILFAEVARRSLKHLRQQEIFILFYMTGIALATPFQGLLWSQYLVQSDVAQAMGVAAKIPSWFAPSAEQIREVGLTHGNTFFHKIWLYPILLISFQLLITRVNGFGLGYVLYRLNAHVEKLPFPMAPVNAQGVLVLAEDKENRNQWRWTAFAIGGIMGLGFGFIYVGIPSLTGSLLGTPARILPIPWMDLTTTFEGVMPATPVNIIFDLTLVIVGMVLPYWAVIGGFLGMLFVFVMNPLLYRAGKLPSWQPGMGVVDTQFYNGLDFYISFGIGLTFAVFFLTLATAILPKMIRGLRARASQDGTAKTTLREGMAYRPSRGDIPVWISLLIYVLSTFLYIGVSRLLLGPGFNWLFFLGFAFIYTPLISYANSKLEGMIGQVVQVPNVREAAFLLSGYSGVEIWFAPLPIVDYGTQTRMFRSVELTGTKTTSLIRTELISIPVVIVASLLFSQFIWRLGPIPSEAYPFTQEVWRQQALTNCLTYTATMSGGSRFLEALNLTYIMYGLGGAVVVYGLLSLLGLPTMIIYGFIRTCGQMQPGAVVPEVLGAVLGRYVFRKRFGEQQWRRAIPVVLAGFTCGIGLMAMAGVGVALIAKSINVLLY